MGILNQLYNRVLDWAKHKHASYYLAGLSFAESSVFPIPPDVMLAPMVLARPVNAWRLAAVTTIASVLGGLLGYMIGLYAFGTLGQWMIQFFGFQEGYQTAVSWFEHWGFAVVLLAGLTPIPYKAFTLAAGVATMPLLPFVLASVIGRGIRFFGVAALVKIFGEKIDKLVIKYLDRVGWFVILSLMFAYIGWKFLG